MSLRQVTFIAMIGCSIALALSLANYGEVILHQRIWPKFWFNLATVVVRDGSIIFFLSHLYRKSSPRS